MSTPASRGIVNVAEINPYAPRPYTFSEAALCIRDMLRAAGYTCELYLNRTDAERRTIVLGALPPHLPAVDQLDPRRTVICNFEQLASMPSVTGAQYPQWLRRWLVADYHSANIEWLRSSAGGSQQAIELPLVPGPSIAFRPELPYEPAVDVLFYGTSSPRREEIMRRLRASGLQVELVEGAYGHELTPAIKRARLVLHVHFYATGLFPIARVLQPVAQGVPVVCERSVFSRHADWSASGIAFADYDDIVATCLQLAGDAQGRRERAARTQAFAASLDVATPLHALVAALDRLAAPIAPPNPIARPAPFAPPVPIGPPVASAVSPRPQAQPAAEPAGDEPLSDAAIEAMLLADAQHLPPEAHLPAPPLEMAQRQPGEGRYGRWWLALLIIFSAWTLWTLLR